MTKKITFLAAALTALFLFSAPSGAQYEPGVPFAATISDVTVVAGQSVTIDGTCAEAEVAVSIDDEARAIVPLGTIPVDDDGTFSGAVTIPDLAVGTYSVFADCGGEVLTIDIEVVAATTGTTPSTGGGDTLARTGSATDTLAKIGGGLVLAGAAAMLLSSKRRRSAA